jgi:AbrB family looped-hinge helix DNA binding protein
MESTDNQPGRHIRARVTEAGRVVIPAELRKELGIEEGQDVVFTRDGNGIRIITLEEAIRQVQDYFAGLAPPEVLLSEELIAERRQEAAKEGRE